MNFLKKYQEKAVNKLISRTKEYFEDLGMETIVLQAPTGSGKTFIASKYICEIVKELTEDVCFLWVSIGKGELHKQSMKSVKREIDNSIQCSLLEEEFFGTRKNINQNEIVFLNWEKIRSKDKITKEWKNIAMKDSENTNFIEVLENTRQIGRKIILIIDESHSSSKSERALEIRDNIVRPDLTIEMSATPVLTKNSDTKITVNPDEVIESGMIKKEVLINNEIDIENKDEITSQELIIKSAIKCREKLAKLYKENGSNVNPLVLIQIPNSEVGENKKNAVISILKDYNITEENGKVAIWLTDEKINNNSELLLPIDSKVEYLIFKQAIDTGWDCPRAQILVRFRDTNSIIFEIQTVGRILRMPEAKHYTCEELNKAYVYTNIESIMVKKETYNPNIIKTLYSKRDEKYSPIKLLSYYKQRVDIGSITPSFYPIFEKEFCHYFNIELATIPDYYKNMEQLKKQKVITNFNKMDKIIKNGIVSSKKIDEMNEDIKTDTIDINYSNNDLEAKFEEIIISNLNGFAQRRSISPVKQAIYYTFKKHLNLNVSKGGSIHIQSLIVKNQEIFSIILDKSTNIYKQKYEEEIKQKSTEKYNPNWEIPISKNYNPTVYTKLELPLSLYQPLYIRINEKDEPNDLEVQFLKYINNHPEKYEWIWQNGQEHMETNFGIKKEDGTTFQPDFIIKYKDGRIGIFDTKASKNREEDNLIKATALRKYINEERFKGKNLIGGLIIKSGEHFRINLQEEYIPFSKKESDWEYFQNI